MCTKEVTVETVLREYFIGKRLAGLLFRPLNPVQRTVRTKTVKRVAKEGARMRRRRDRIGDRGTRVIILKGWLWTVRKWVLLGDHPQRRRTATLGPWDLGPGVPDRFQLEPMAKSLCVERKRYHAHFRSHSLLPSTLMLLFCGAIICCFK